MIKQTYLLKLASPAFLGGADQRGAWRTPPIKALLREWWRIAMAHRLGYDHRQIKNDETRLFGTAADETGGENQRSQIRLALAHWREGTCTTWPSEERRVNHPEVQDRNTGQPRPVGSELYLGYGPLIFQQGTRLKNGAALQADETNSLRLALPNAEQAYLQRTVTLAHWFGTLGGRSRNGWGSLLWTADQPLPALAPLTASALNELDCTRTLEQCLELDWPHAIGSDSRGALVWRSCATFADWHEAMRFVAQTKIGFRTNLAFNSGSNSARVEARHVLAYPVTNHSVKSWGNNARVANTLRFKLHVEAEGRLRALLYHTPCKPTLPHAGLDLLNTWQHVHRFLDAQPTLARLV